MRISDWSSDVCSSDLNTVALVRCSAAQGFMSQTRTAKNSAANRRIILCTIQWRKTRWPSRGCQIQSNLSLQRMNREILNRSEEHTSELQSLMRISYAVFCLTKKNQKSKHMKHSYKQKTNKNNE